MTAVAERQGVDEVPEHSPPVGLLAFLTSTDHKRIGISYMVTAFAFFVIGGAMAMLIRAELLGPGEQVVSEARYNELFTMHGSVMMFLFLGPFAFGLANYLVPLHAGARDMAFPRVNAMSYWFYLFGGLTMLGGFLGASGAANFGWTAYTPLSDVVRSPGVGADLWIMGVVLTGLSGVLTAVNIVTTVFLMRAPGMTMFRLPIFTWNMLVVSVLVLISFPVLTSAGAMLFADRHLGAHVFDADAGGEPILWQHLFWFFGHPEVYILALPYFGVVSEVIPVFSRRPLFGYKGVVLATILIAAYSVGVWAHHMFTTGAVLLPFFAGLSFLIAVPTGIKFFNWIGTMWGGQIRFSTPLLFSIGFLLLFLVGGITGVMLASPPIDFHLHDSYFVVAHMHYVLIGGSTFALFAAIYYWWPKFTGRVLSERLGKAHFWLLFVGFNLTFFVQFVLGLRGMPRRVADYYEADGWTGLNQLSSIGAFLTGIAIVPFLWNVWISRRRGEPAGDNPWGGHTLEWATSSPPPSHNFDSLPPIRSSRPVWDRDPRGRRSSATAMNDLRIQWMVFAGIGALVTVMTAIYWLSSDEDAGTVLLLLSATLSWFAAGYLWFQQRRLARPDAEPDEHDEYLPHQSVWPLGIGVAAFLMANGLILGVLFLVPGALLLLFSVAGFAAQSRHRT